MKSRRSLASLPNEFLRGAVAILSVGSLALDNPPALAQQTQAAPPSQPAQSQVMTTTAPVAGEAPTIPNDQLDSLVAPIALYPDPLLAQTLAAATYPLEIIQLQQWLQKNPNLKDSALADALAKQPWDPSIQAMAAFPEVVKRLADDVQWTTELGNAFLAQQADVLAAVQRMRAKAQGTGALQTSAQQVVATETVDGQQAIVIQQADPAVVYVPTYNPTVVYGAPVYPYPSIYYPVAGTALVFGAGIALGAAWGGGWGYNCGWGRGNVNVNVNNTYVNHYNKNVNRNVNNANINRANNTWQHNPQHRGGTPYAGGAAGAGRVGAVGVGGGAAGAGRAGAVGVGGGAAGAGRAGAVGVGGGAAGVGGAGAVGAGGGAAGAGRAGAGGAVGVGGGAAGAAGAGGGAAGAGRAGAGGSAGAGGGAAGAAGVGGGAAGAGRAGAGGSAGAGGGAAGGGRAGANGAGAGGASRSGGGGDRVGGRNVSSGGGGGAFGGGNGNSARASSSRGAKSTGGNRGGNRGGGGRR